MDSFWSSISLDWTSISLERLAALQGIQPVNDLDEISALWPVDDDPDRLFAHILEERSARRGVVRRATFISKEIGE